MNEADFRVSSCYRKNRFPTEKEAKKFYENYKRKNKEANHNLHVYPCHYCGGYHIGKKQPQNDDSSTNVRRQSSG